jgi:prephenate dehydrogenase
VLPETLGVIGLGALGGSVAWRAARAGVPRILGNAQSTRDGAAAVRVGAVTEFVHHPEVVVRSSDLVVLATPPTATLRLLRQFGPVLLERGVCCTDVTNVKRPIVRAAERLGLAGVFAGSHPLIDLDSRGFAAARPDSLADAIVYVTPLANGERAAAEVADFWSRALHAHPVTMTAEQHDALVAWTSQLPHVAASALAGTLRDGGPAGVTFVRGLLEATRLATLDTAAWSELLLANRDNVLRVLEGFSGSLDGLRSALTAEDQQAVRAWLQRGVEWRRKYD